MRQESRFLFLYLCFVVCLRRLTLVLWCLSSSLSCSVSSLILILFIVFMAFLVVLSVRHNEQHQQAQHRTRTVISRHGRARSSTRRVIRSCVSVHVASFRLFLSVPLLGSLNPCFCLCWSSPSLSLTDQSDASPDDQSRGRCLAPACFPAARVSVDDVQSVALFRSFNVFSPSLVHSLCHSAPTCPPTHPPTHSLTHSHTHSHTLSRRCLTDSPTGCLTRYISDALHTTCSRTHLLTYAPIPALLHSHLPTDTHGRSTHLLVHSFTQSHNHTITHIRPVLPRSLCIHFIAP